LRWTVTVSRIGYRTGISDTAAVLDTATENFGNNILDTHDSFRYS